MAKRPPSPLNFLSSQIPVSEDNEKVAPSADYVFPSTEPAEKGPTQLDLNIEVGSRSFRPFKKLPSQSQI
jgi:hypothetical protein